MAKIIISSSIILSVCVILMTIVPQYSADETSPSLFVLGDSTADVGTNNYIPGSLVRADFLPYGIDFPGSRPTGRYSNGYNIADFVAEFLGLQRSPPPFLSLLARKKPQYFQRNLYKGVNFASAGCGLLDTTGRKGMVVPLSEQIAQFSTVKDNITALIGSAATETLLSKALFFISIGGNDIFGYFATNCTIPKDQFIGILMSTYSNHITNLYNLGARKFGIIGIPPLGCVPAQRLVQKLITGTDGCFETENDFAISFYTALGSLLTNISSELQEFKYSLGNGYKIVDDIINNPNASGFENLESACCGTGMFNAQGTCNSTASVCSDRSKYLFWDSYHPTQEAAYQGAKQLYNGSPSYVSPITFTQLALGSITRKEFLLSSDI